MRTTIAGRLEMDRKREIPCIAPKPGCVTVWDYLNVSDDLGYGKMAPHSHTVAWVAGWSPEDRAGRQRQTGTPSLGIRTFATYRPGDEGLSVSRDDGARFPGRKPRTLGHRILAALQVPNRRLWR